MIAPDVLKAIPHRPPFLFIDRVLERTADGIIAERTIRAEESFFEGHYPGNPLMPGVLICEAAFQAAGIYLSERSPVEDEAVATPVLVRIENARFRQMVRPGDTIQIDVKWKESSGGFHFLKATVRVDKKAVATLDFVLNMMISSGS